MSAITETAHQFFEACDAGKGWEACAPYCTADATFAAQSEPLADVTTVEHYSNWMKGLLGPLPDARYELKSFATDTARNNVSAFATFHGTHSGDGGPVPATGKATATDYVYVMQFNDAGKINHVTKIWHSGLALQELGWG
ncbi:MAG: nuclear transport factor 2 family protein [Hyphomicrobiaceae bacterium]